MVEQERAGPLVEKTWEFSKKLTFLFLMIFMFHLGTHMVSALLMLGDYKMIKESFTGTLPFYAAMFGTYLGKAIYENRDRFAKKFSIDMKELEIEEEQTVTTLNNCGNG